MNMKWYVRKYQFIRLLIALIPSAEMRTKIIRKTHFFYEMGENCHFQPRILPADPKFVKIHNNVAIASGVNFETHDIIQKIFNNLEGEEISHQSHLACIEIMDNCFIGDGAFLMGGIRIGPNAIVGAGSVVTKDVPKGAIVAGNPAKQIGFFDDLLEKRRKEAVGITETDRTKRIEPEWIKFYQSKKSI